MIRPALLPQKVDALNDAVLAKWKPFDAVVASRTQRSSTAVTAYNRSILNVIGADHQLFIIRNIRRALDRVLSHSRLG